MLEFQKITLKNFGPFGNSPTTIELNRKKTVLVSGANAQGKSFAFLDAITFGLFGKPFRNINIPQLINAINKKQCIVEVYFVRGKDEYMVRRGIAPKLFEIFKNGVLIDQDARTKDYQELLEEYILGFNFHAFKQVVVLGKASFVPFMQLVPAERRKVVENVLDLGILSDMAVYTKITIAEKRTQYQALLQEEVILSEQLKIQEENFKKIQSNKDKNLEEKLELINKSEQVLESLKKEREVVRSSLQTLQEEVNKLQKIKSKKDEVLKQYSILQNDLKKINEEILRVENTDCCDKCGQKMTETAIEHSLKNRKETKNEYERFVRKATEMLRTFDSSLCTFDETLSQAADLQRKFTEISTAIHTEEALLNREISDYEKLKNSDNTLPDIEGTKTLLNDNRKKIQQVVEEIEYYEYTLEMFKDNGLKAKIIKHYIPIINKYMNDYLNKLGLFVEFKLDENFTETIKARYRDEFSYNCFSEGEKQRIDLAILLTWREVAKVKNSLNCNILIFDDLLDGPLETAGIESFMKIINQMKSKVTIYNLSWKSDQLVDKFDEHISVQKKHNFAKLVYNT